MSTTTTTSAKNRVLAWVRERNPQTMELKFGCMFQFKSGFVTPSDGEVLPDKYCNRPFFLMSHNIRDDNPWQTSDIKTTVLTFCDLSSFTSAISLKVGTEIPMSYFLVNLDILGSDMGLEHLMKALQLHPCTDTKLVDDGRLTVTEYPPRCQTAGISVITHFDFDKNLHSQAPEFYESLLSLIL